MILSLQHFEPFCQSLSVNTKVFLDPKNTEVVPFFIQWLQALAAEAKFIVSGNIQLTTPALVWPNTGAESDLALSDDKSGKKGNNMNIFELCEDLTLSLQWLAAEMAKSNERWLIFSF